MSMCDDDENDERSVLWYRSVSSLNLVLVDARDGLQVTSSSCAGALSVLGLEWPSILAESGSGVAAGRACAFLFVVGHTSTASAESVGLGVSATEGRCASTHCVVINYMPILKYSIINILQQIYLFIYTKTGVEALIEPFWFSEQISTNFYIDKELI